MKTLTTFLSIISIVAVITACEKSLPELEFDLSLIPGQYNGINWVYEYYYDTVSGTYLVEHPGRRIPDMSSGQIFCTVNIRRVKENHYAFAFEPIDTILPTELTYELIASRGYNSYDATANLRGLENNLFRDSINSDMVSFGNNPPCFYINELGFGKIWYKLVLISKTQDGIYLECSGSRRLFDH